MSVEEDIENFKQVIEKMQGKVAAISERMSEAYKKLNQLEMQKWSLVSSSDHLIKELHKLSNQVSLIEDPQAPRGKGLPGETAPSMHPKRR